MIIQPKKEDRRPWLRLRIYSVGVCFAAVFVVLLMRAGDLQLLKHQWLTSRAEGEFLRPLKLTARRGVIYDRNQEELAVSLDTDSIYASPLKVQTPQQTGSRLGKALRASPREISAQLAGEKGFVWIARRVDSARAHAVRELDLPGVGLIKEPRRFYPNTTLACHLLGFAGLDSRGLEGLELQYDAVLKGQGQTLLTRRDALGRVIHLDPAQMADQPEGRHLILTLDKRLQYQVEKILAATVDKYKAKSGQALVMVPRTGEILAMASYPVFNPNIFSRYRRDTYRNRVITDLFEPGSTFKAFTAAAALASHRVSLEQRFDCQEGEWTLGEHVIHDTHAHGKLSLAEIVKYSSNIGIAKVGAQVGPADLHKVLSAFGFGQKTGIDLPGEAKGILRPAREWQPVDLANICFGQGVAVSTLQLASALGSVANGGVLMRPYLVRAIVDHQGGLVSETQPRVVRRVMGVREARILTKMLIEVTEEGGTGTQARVEPFTVAGKTGTAQKVAPGGGYSNTEYMASFMGFVPAEDPQVLVMVVIDTPRGQTYGGQVAAPAFAAAARAALNLLGVHPASPEAPMQVARQNPTPAAPSAPSLALVSQELRQGRAPDLGGLTLRQVLRLAGQGDLKLRIQGWGRVVSQSPAPGQPLKGRIMLRLHPGLGGA